jgi:hypothetical protein
MSPDETKIIGNVNVGDARGATVIGVQLGPNRDERREDLRQVLTESLDELLLKRGVIANFEHRDEIGASLYACEGTSGSGFGFAANNSGLIVCPTSIGGVRRVRQLVSGKSFDSEAIAGYSMFQGVRISIRTRGLIPAYRSEPVFNEELYGFDGTGQRCKAKAKLYSLSIKIKIGSEFKLLTDAIGIISAPDPGTSALKIDGPVFNSADEIMGVCVARASRGDLTVVQPWSSIEKCLRMTWEEFPAG